MPEQDIVYSRYCDDIFRDFAAAEVIGKVKGFLDAMGLNSTVKTKVPPYQRDGDRHCGQRQVSVPAAYRRELRQDIYYCRNLACGSI